jgi:hypothetical protein
MVSSKFVGTFRSEHLVSEALTRFFGYSQILGLNNSEPEGIPATTGYRPERQSPGTKYPGNYKKKHWRGQ